MTDEDYTFEQARARLEEIAVQAKDAPLEKCLDLLEEGVRMANICTERIDHTQWREVVEGEEQSPEEDAPEAGEEPDDEPDDEPPGDEPDEEPQEEPEEEPAD